MVGVGCRSCVKMWKPTASKAAVDHFGAVYSRSVRMSLSAGLWVPRETSRVPGRTTPWGRGVGRVDEGCASDLGSEAVPHTTHAVEGRYSASILWQSIVGVRNRTKLTQKDARSTVALREDGEGPAARSQISDHCFTPMDLWVRGGELGDKKGS